MSERMTSAHLPGVRGAAIADWGRRDPVEMIEYLRTYARQQMEWAQKVLSAADAEFRVETYTGVHVQRNREVLQEGAARKALSLYGDER